MRRYKRTGTIRNAVRENALSSDRMLVLAAALSIPLLLLMFIGCANAENSLVLPQQPAEMESAPVLLPGAFAGAPRVYGTSRPLGQGWRATYGLGDADETSLYSTFLRLEEFREEDVLAGRTSRDNWRHFLGIEYQPLRSFTLLGGIAKSSGTKSNKDIALAPTGYERLRFNTGLRWRGDEWGFEGWGLDTTFSFIPTGATRVMGDGGFMPGIGNSSATWLMSLTISRRF
jgi:hypothetical protein